MLLAGMLDLGLPLSAVHGALVDLGLSKVRLRIKRIRQNGIHALQVSCVQRKHYFAIPREAGSVINLIQRSKLERNLKAHMVRAMTALAKAEGKVHGATWRKVRFQQVGRLDTWVNFIGVSLGIIHFQIEKLFVSAIPLGACHEGHDGRRRLFPGPAACQLLKRFRTLMCREPFEWTTPTAATLLWAFGSPEPPPPFRVVGIGHGIGHRQPPQGPGALRLLLGVK